MELAYRFLFTLVRWDVMLIKPKLDHPFPQVESLCPKSSHTL